VKSESDRTRIPSAAGTPEIAPPLQRTPLEANAPVWAQGPPPKICNLANLLRDGDINDNLLPAASWGRAGATSANGVALGSAGRPAHSDARPHDPLEHQAADARTRSLLPVPVTRSSDRARRVGLTGYAHRSALQRPPRARDRCSVWPRGFIEVLRAGESTPRSGQLPDLGYKCCPSPAPTFRTSGRRCPASSEPM